VTSSDIQSLQVTSSDCQSLPVFQLEEGLRIEMAWVYRVLAAGGVFFAAHMSREPRRSRQTYWESTCTGVGRTGACTLPIRLPAPPGLPAHMGGEENPPRQNGT